MSIQNKNYKFLSFKEETLKYAPIYPGRALTENIKHVRTKSQHVWGSEWNNFLLLLGIKKGNWVLICLENKK